MDIENLPEVQGELVIEEGWSTDEAGLPIFSAGSIDLLENELVEIRATEGEQKLKLAAILAEASDRRFYGDGTLKRVAKENNMSHPTARSLVAGYKRLQELNVDDREVMVSIIKSGELYWSKVQIAASVKDDQTFTELMHTSADGSLTNSKLRKRVASITGQKAIDAPESHEDTAGEDAEEPEGVGEPEGVEEPEEAPEDIPQDLGHPEKLIMFLSGTRVQAEELNAEGGCKDLELEETSSYYFYLEELETLRKMTRTWSDQIKRQLKQRGE